MYAFNLLELTPTISLTLPFGYIVGGEVTRDKKSINKLCIHFFMKSEGSHDMRSFEFCTYGLSTLGGGTLHACDSLRHAR